MELSRIVAAAALAATCLVATVETASAAPVLTPSATSVAVGGTLSATATGCVDPQGERFRYLEYTLITGTGAGARAAGFGNWDGGYRSAVIVPGWVDPDEPAVLAGRCVEERYDPQRDDVALVAVVTYPDVAIDLTPATGATTTPVLVPSRTTAAVGQDVAVRVEGCAPGALAVAALIRGDDLTLRGDLTWVTETAVAGTDEVRLALNGAWGVTPATGAHVLLGGCLDGDGERLVLAEPQPFTVSGTNPIGDISVDDTQRGVVHLAGGGCLAGPVSVTVTGYAYDDADLLRSARRTARRSFGREAIGLDGEFTETLTAQPDGTGAWKLDWTTPPGTYEAYIETTCGDPAGTGFRYEDRWAFGSLYLDLWVERVSPTSAPVGTPVTVHAYGDCAGDAAVRFRTRAGAILATAPARQVAPGAYTGTLPAPATAGTHVLDVACGDGAGYPSAYEVFQPTRLAAERPLPAEPATGWPARGPRETYHGRIGPISVPGGEEHGGHGEAMTSRSGTEPRAARAARLLPPSDLFIPLDKPDGDFAITGITFDLVDEHGDPVPQHDVHLHHFLWGDAAEENPACPSSTFGIPGSIIAATGAERTPLAMADPYGIVVRGDDRWNAVYDLMNMSGEDHTVYLTYDITYRRDVADVRPVENYFGSTSGCSSFAWDLYGSGTPDVQSHYVTMARDGVLVGAGGHLHNGGLHTDVVDDRGRRVCRSELHVGDGGGGSGGGHGHRGARTSPAPTQPGDWVELPELYPDDPPLEGITTCSVRERVRAGQRFRVDAVYDDLRPRAGVMGIYSLYVWHGGGPDAPTTPPPGGAKPIRARPTYTG